MKRLIATRCLLGILILLNLWLIFSFSSESAAESNQTSQVVTETVAQVVVKDFENKTPEEQAGIVREIHPTVRKLAHMAEFSSLAFLIMLLISTWKLSPPVCAALALLATLPCAIADEVYQYVLPGGRAGQVKDVLIDMAGGAIACSILLFLVFFIRFMKKRALKKPLHVSRYTVSSRRCNAPLQIALVSDLHDNPYERAVQALQKEKPDLILIPGDLTDDEHIRAGGDATLDFLRACAEIAPTYYSLGNHEIACYHSGNPFRHPNPIPVPDEFFKAVASAGATLLDNSGTRLGDTLIFGLTSGINGKENKPDADAIARFEASDASLKLLLCHHPEYYVPYLEKSDADLVVCGHAHGGHWRIFGRGVYAPGQGLFPKYTSGVTNGVCVISRGIGNHTSIPRIMNPTEIVMISLTPLE